MISTTTIPIVVIDATSAVYDVPLSLLGGSVEVACPVTVPGVESMVMAVIDDGDCGVEMVVVGVVTVVTLVVVSH